MGQRMKKKSQQQHGSPAGNKMGAASRDSSSTAPPSTGTASPSESSHLVLENGPAVDPECSHLPNLLKLRNQLAKSTVICCLECAKLRSGVSAGKERKGKGRGIKKKQHPATSSLAMLDEKMSGHKVWVCLSCGHVGCGEGNSSALLSNGGGGEPTKQEIKQGAVGRGHAWQHWLQLKHQLVMLCEEDFACWCFVCELAHVHDFSAESLHPPPVEGETEVLAPSSRVVLLHQAAKLVQVKLTEQYADVRDDSRDPNGSEEAEETIPPPIEPVIAVEEEHVGRKNQRVMKGLINLGNTCFFNSVMQNLLSVELLREHFCPESSVDEGALTSSLRNFFQEASAYSQPATNYLSESGAKKSVKARGGWSSVDGTINPKALFAAICSKAPRFKGFQQQDSHELLRCLLDGLHTEEESVRKASSKPKSMGGEDALRALLKTDAQGNDDTAVLANREDAVGSLLNTEDGNEGKDVANATQQKKVVRPETFVEQVFGGQLSSTVSCCECGHSSVVYESFLDLSLPIPSKKPSKKASAMQTVKGNGSSVGPSRRGQSLRNSKSYGKSNSDSNAFNSTPAGLGAPLLLLPPPPPKDENSCYINTDSRLGDGLLNYANPGTVSDDTDWLDFLDDDENVESQTILGCAPNPEPESLQDYVLNAESYNLQDCALSPDSETLHGFASNLEAETLPSSEIVLDSGPNAGSESLLGLAPSAKSEISFGCAPNLSLMKQSSEGLVASASNGTRQTCLDSLTDGCQFPVELKKDDDFRIADLSSAPNVGRGATQNINNLSCEMLMFVESCPETVGEAKNCSWSCEAEKSGFRPIRGLEADVQVQMRGGSDSQSFGLTQEGELDYCPVVEQVKDTSASVEQSWDCNDSTRMHSDIINGPNGIVILLGPPVENRPAAACPNLLLDGDYDGVGSLFDEEDNNEDKLYGPLPSNHDGAECEAISAYDEIAFDDVLDLSKISSEGRTDWLVSSEGRHSDENDEASMSLEGCLQIFTRSELLSGENAWACENCTKQYLDNLAESSAKELPQEPLMKRTDGIQTECGYSSAKRSNGVGPEELAVIDDGITLEDTDHGVSDDGAAGDIAGLSGKGDAANCNDDLSRKGSDPVNREMNSSDNIVAHGNHVTKADVAIETAMEGEACQGSGDNSFTHPLQKLAEPIHCELDGVVQSPEEGSICLDTQVEGFGYTVKGVEVDDQKPVVVLSSSEPGNKFSVVNSRSSGRKLKKSKSRKVQEEIKKVIKQEATKRFLISRAPPVLTIQLKRFAQDMRGRLSKLSGHVAFQEWLDLSPFLDHRHVNFDCKYRLIGTVEHSGTLKGGHYVAFVRGSPSSAMPKVDTVQTCSDASSWYYISDSHVHQTNLEAVLQSEAYLVFYERVDVPYDKLHVE